MEPAPGHGELFVLIKPIVDFIWLYLKFLTNRTLIMSDNIYTPPKFELPAVLVGISRILCCGKQKMRSVIFYDGGKCTWCTDV